MDLEKLKKQLYEPEVKFDERQKQDLLGSEKEKEPVVSSDWLKVERKIWLTDKWKLYLKKAAIFGGAFLVLLTIFFTWRGLTSFNNDKVYLEISGPQKTDSGEEVKYSVQYKNKTRQSLTNVKLIFHYPDGAFAVSKNLIESFNLPDLAAKQESATEISFRLFGLKGDVKKVSAELSYQPGKLSSRFSHEAEFGTEIVSVPLVLNFDLPAELASGQSFEFSVNLANQSDASFDNINVQLEYPSGFEFKSSSPEISDKNHKIWEIGTVGSREEKEITIKGKITGEAGETKPFRAQAGTTKDDQFVAYGDAVGSVGISLSPLSISQTVNGQTSYAAKAGETLEFKIKYINTTGVGVKNAIITAKLEGEVLDLTSLNADKGSYDGATQTISWKASNLPALEYLSPRQEGETRFLVQVKNPLPIRNYTDKNFVVSSKLKIDSTEAPQEDIKIAGESELIVKVLSQLTIEAQGFYQDETISNTGPIPPKVGQTTTYTLKWRLINSANELENVKVSGYLPPHVAFLNKIVPADYDLTYTAQTGQVVWNIGRLAAATGILSPVKEVSFQVSITPSLASLNNLVELIGQTTATGRDVFVGSDITATDQPIDTNLPDDPTVEHQGGIVVQ